MSLTFSAGAVPITSTRSKTRDVRPQRFSTSGVPPHTGPLGEHAEPRRAEENTQIYIDGSRLDAEVLCFTQANLKRLEGKDFVAAALASVVPSLSPSETTSIPRFEGMAKVANAKVKAWRRAAREEN